MRWNDMDSEPCPVARTLAVIGDRWTVLILRDALRGVSRFEAFHDRLKCSRAIIAERLSRLVERGVMERVAYADHPPRHDYRLTDMGRALSPVLMMMTEWAEAWAPAPNGYRVQRVHKTCGHAFRPVLQCSECGEPLRPGEVQHVDPVRTAEPA